MKGDPRFRRVRSRTGTPGLAGPLITGPAKEAGPPGLSGRVKYESAAELACLGCFAFRTLLVEVRVRPRLSFLARASGVNRFVSTRSRKK